MNPILIALLILAASINAFAQVDSQNEKTESLNENDQQELILPGSPSDAASKKILNNHITAIGAKDGIENIVAHGTFTYRNNSKKYTLVETSDGRRALTLKWTYMGNDYTETIVSVPHNIAQIDVPDLWRIITKAIRDKNDKPAEERVYLKMQRGGEILQEEIFGHTTVSFNARLPSKQFTYKQRRVISGNYAERSAMFFKTVPLFMHDFFNRELSMCRYMGTEKLNKRDVYVIRRDVNSSYYIDKEKFLLLQWGQMESFGGKRLEVSYMANSYKYQTGSSRPILLPSKISILASGQLLGNYSVDQVAIDTTPDPSIFVPPSI